MPVEVVAVVFEIERFAVVVVANLSVKTAAVVVEIGKVVAVGVIGKAVVVVSGKAVVVVSGKVVTVGNLSVKIVVAVVPVKVVAVVIV